MSGFQQAEAHESVPSDVDEQAETSKNPSTDSADVQNGLANSVLGKLPPELRIAVYEFVLTHPKPIQLVRVDDKTSEADKEKSNAQTYRMLRYYNRRLRPARRYYNKSALLKTCRQINREATPLLYATNDFELARTGSRSRCPRKYLSRFARQIGPTNFRMIKEFGVCFLIPHSAHKVYVTAKDLIELLEADQIRSCTLRLSSSDRRSETSQDRQWDAVINLAPDKVAASCVAAIANLDREVREDGNLLSGSLAETIRGVMAKLGIAE